MYNVALFIFIKLYSDCSFSKYLTNDEITGLILCVHFHLAILLSGLGLE